MKYGIVFRGSRASPNRNSNRDTGSGAAKGFPQFTFFVPRRKLCFFNKKESAMVQINHLAQLDFR
jgi:hypothetical protein